MPTLNLSLLALILCVACAPEADNQPFASDNNGNGGNNGSGGNNGTGGDEEAPREPVVVDVDAYCDGNASLLDWLIVIEATTDLPAYDVTCNVSQGPYDYGNWNLNDEGNGRDWYGEIWEDTLGIDCEGAVWTVDCWAD